ncbi:MAG: penicillin-binding protein 2 [Chloroflexi bacterium]|nr:penicillin-binding protein 2 [Chloroflexota bacterium]
MNALGSARGGTARGGAPRVGAPRVGAPRVGVRHPGVGATLGRVALTLAIAFGGLAAGAGYWQVIRSDDLASSPDDAAVIAAGRDVARGEITDRDGVRLAWSLLDPNGEPYRKYVSSSISGVIGYASRAFGSAGLERAYEAELTGVTAADPVQDLVKKFRAAATDPQSIRTTLVAQLQEAAVRALGNDRGAVVMLDPRTGEVIVLASTPVFDASAVANPDTSLAAFAVLQSDPDKPLLPRATQGRYVPGSVFKIVTAIAGLGSGAITAATTFPQQPAAEKNGLLVSGYRVRDGHHPATGSTALDLVGATEVSCNIYYALVGLETGGDALASWAGQLGFGEPIPFDLQTAASQVTDGGGSFGGGFSDAVELANASYGQAETVVTPLQMALVAGTIANRGVLMRPHLVQAFMGRSGIVSVDPQVWRQVLAPDLADDIAAAMRQAVEGRLGRQFTTGARVAGMAVAGKSGTAELGGTGEPNSWFIGFAPAEDPRIAIAVVVEQGGRGAERAAPIGGKLLALWKTWAGL